MNRGLSLIGAVLGVAFSTPLLAQLPLNVTRDAYITGDTHLNTGKPAEVTYIAPAKNWQTAQVVSGTNPKNVLWNIAPDPWGLTAGSGTMTLNYSGDGEIKSVVKLAGLKYKGAVTAYPFIGYGADVFGYSIHGQGLRFPTTLSSMASLVFDVKYDLEGKFTGSIDVLFDEWLMPTPTYSGGGKGSVEVEILPYYQFATGLFGKRIQTFQVPATLNGRATTLSYEEYSSAPGKGAGSIVLFYPNQQLKAADLRFDALLFIKEAAAAAKVPEDWYVPGFDFGTEFGESATEDFTFTVKKVGIEQTMKAADSSVH